MRYLVTQPVKHALSEHAGLVEGSCFQDLVGARLLGGFSSAATWRWLPRWTPSRLCRVVEMTRPEPVDARALASVSLEQILAGARVALCTELSGHSPAAVRARRSAVGIATDAGFRADDVAQALGCTRRAVSRLRRRPDQEARRAVEVRLALELALQSRGVRGPPGGIS